MHTKILILQVAALGWNLLERHGTPAGFADRLKPRPVSGIFPALTCPVQATMRTAAPPATHGMIANGIFDRRQKKALFWEQSSAWVEGERIWDRFRRRGGRVALWFWQQSLGEAVDQVLSPAPVHRHHGGIIDTCLSRPAALYPRLCRAVGRRFRLSHYWGPTASTASSQWIADALCVLLNEPDAPELCLAYLPGLDYDLQRHGPAGPAAARALQRTLAHITQITDLAERRGYEPVVYGDYAITGCRNGAVFPNRRLAQNGWLATRKVRGRIYADLFHSRAFAMTDHAVAPVHVEHPGDLTAVRDALAALDGIACVWDRDAQSAHGIWHPDRSPPLLAVAAPGRWLAYPWWSNPREAPDYAGHVDIHNKPGYDPGELFWNHFPFSVGGDPARIGGTHGRCDDGSDVVLAAGGETAARVTSLAGLAATLRERLS